jgi:maltooligosyltrehalose synthase
MTKVLPMSKDGLWWRQAAIYQIYPRSFHDSNGDGIGDLNGITNKIHYLKSLNIDAVWLSPFYPSALADGGYDVDDYRDVDPKIGTLKDFDRMVSAFHKEEISVIVDIVPNHSSNRHKWFLEALASEPGSKARNRYILEMVAGRMVNFHQMIGHHILHPTLGQEQSIQMEHLGSGTFIYLHQNNQTGIGITAKLKKIS